MDRGDKTGVFHMASIPLDLQRRFEQRWAARFARPNPPNTPKHQVERQDQELDTLGKAKTITHRGQASGLQTCPREVSAGPKSRAFRINERLSLA
jgi:hypothetical protein